MIELQPRDHVKGAFQHDIGEKDQRNRIWCPEGPVWMV